MLDVVTLKLVCAVTTCSYFEGAGEAAVSSCLRSAADTERPADPHRAASTASLRDPSSHSSCFRRSLSAPCFLEQQIAAARCVRSILRSSDAAGSQWITSRMQL
ncbi:hypothetical protein Q5P01_004808 [Channa striata]|uniref:Uncharacterized protein n=1 Tax=Channa striata TaxID=64152 RepID=A0AA88SXX0_CHASR|nr:hypothetical protein Q5P01_004808 [Channa striata]